MDMVEQRSQRLFRAVKLDLHLQWLQRERGLERKGLKIYMAFSFV